MKYGYARISTPQQSIDRQIRNIEGAYPGEHIKIYLEAFTGTVMARPEWTKLMKQVRAGDTIIFDSVSRMSRDAAEGFQVYEDLYSKGVNLVFLKEHHIDTDTYKSAADRQLDVGISTGDEKTDKLMNAVSSALNEFMMDLAREQIRIAFEQSEKEVTDLRQRTKEGLETAKRNGKQIGQKQGAKLATKKAAEGMRTILTYSNTFGGSLSDDKCMELAHCSRNTFYKWKRELKSYTPEQLEAIRAGKK